MSTNRTSFAFAVSTRAFATLALGVFAAACSAPSNADPSTELDVTEQGAFVQGGNGQWRDVTSDGAVPVCWMVPADGAAEGAVNDEVKAAVRAAVEREYNGRTHLRFVGFTDCTEADTSRTMVRARFETARTTRNSHPGGLSWVGPVSRRLSSEPAWSQGTLWFGAPKTWSDQTSWLKNATLRAALHEFGHAAGLLHEHERPDAPTCDRADGEREDGNGALMLGAYDAESIMNYCRQDASPTLTVNDIRGVNFLVEARWPKVSSWRSPFLRAGDREAEVELTGAGFDATTVVKSGDTALRTTLVSETTIKATLTTALLATAGVVKISVSNRGPGGETLEAGVELSLTVR